MARFGRAVSLLGLLALAPGCVRGEWKRTLRHEPLPPHATSLLVGGATDLQTCLDLFGAPLWVWEHPDGIETGIAMAYGGFSSQAWGFDVSVPVHDLYSASFRYDDVSSRMPGVVLFFDEDCRLTSWREGLLQDLTAELRARRPSPVD